MYSSIFRMILLGLFIWAAIRLIMLLRPKPSYVISFLEYPRHKEIDCVDEGEFVRLWPSSSTRVINVYRKGVDEGEGLLGQLPARHFDTIEPVLRNGQFYEAVIAENTGENLQLEIKLKLHKSAEEFV